MELSFEKMDNLMWALIFYIAGAIRPADDFTLANRDKTQPRGFHFHVKLGETNKIHNIVAYRGKRRPCSRDFSTDQNVLSVLIIASPSRYVQYHSYTRKKTVSQRISSKSVSAANKQVSQTNLRKLAQQERN